MATSFEVFNHLAETDNPGLKVAPLGNILNMQKCKEGGQILIGVCPESFAGLMQDRFCGGFVLVDKAEFHKAKAELESKEQNP